MVGCKGIKGDPKQAEKVAWGSVTPRSVPATFAVYPLMKWYMACSGVSLEIGGSTPKASAVRKIIFSGWFPIPVSLAFGIKSIG